MDSQTPVAPVAPVTPVAPVAPVAPAAPEEKRVVFILTKKGRGQHISYECLFSDSSIAFLKAKELKLKAPEALRAFQLKCRAKNSRAHRRNRSGRGQFDFIL